MEPVTADQVKAAIAVHGIDRWKLRSCSICHAPLHYLFSGEEVYYQSGCDCSWSPPRLTNYVDVANTLNMQKPEVRDSMWREMLGLTEAATT